MRIPRETVKWLNQMDDSPNALRDCEADDRLHPTAGSPVADHQCDGCKRMSEMAHWEVLCPSRVPGCIGTTINDQENNQPSGH